MKKLKNSNEDEIKEFPIKPIGDWIIIQRIPVLNRTAKKSGKMNLIMAGGMAPKNLLELEQKKAKQNLTYEDAEEEFLKEWDDHPFQGIIAAVGQGRPLGTNDKIPIELKPGDHICYRSRTGEPLVINNKLYWMIKEHEVFGVYND